MEESFDLGRLLRNHQKAHKIKPSQFGSVAGGVKKRLENNLKYRKSSRLTFFDNIRDLSASVSPAPLTKTQSKEDHRRQQLEKWKEQKEKQKKESAAQKKKPFVTGVARAPLKFEPPPPVPKPKPSTSGRVTRSQTSKATTKPKEIKETNSNPSTSKSFAPKNASFRPPMIKNVTNLPKLAAVKGNKDQRPTISFDPVVPNVLKEIKVTRLKTAVDTKPVRKENLRTTKVKVTKSSPKKNKLAKAALQSSSSSDMEKDVKLSPILTSRSSRKSLPAPESPIIVIKTPRKSMPKESKPRTPKNPIPKSESSSEERLRSPKAVEDVPMTPEQIAEEAKKISPCVTISRGKENARKEMKKKLTEGLLDEDASDMDSVDHFRKQLSSEIKRMTEMCETWDKISEQTVLPDAVQEAILSAVGLARLLMSQKLAQFGSLVEKCARPEPGQALVTPADLHGFWDMVFMQVENVDVRFKKLEELRDRGWVEAEPVQHKRKVTKANVKKVAKPSGAPSRLKEMIAAARKAKKEQQPEAPTSLVTDAGSDSKTFEAGFFSVRSPVRSPAARSPSSATPRHKNSLLKAVLSNEAKKSASKSSTSFAMLRASVMGKNMEYEGIAPIPQTPMTPINLYATPGRSILKTSNTGKKSTRKSIKVVLFDRSDVGSLDNSFVTLDSETNEVKMHENPDLDSGISSMDIEKAENKENSARKPRLVRQDAEERSPVLTRSRRKSAITDEVMTPRRSSRKKVLQESLENVEEVAPQRSSRRRKSQQKN